MSSEPRPWDATEVPPEVMAVPAMMTAEERRYLVWVTERAFQGWGAVVELGPWLGGSSLALAEGLRRRRGDGAVVQSFDLFRWQSSYMDQYVKSAGVDLAQGADFMPEFERRTASHSRWIRAQRMDLLQATWGGGPIEILFVDAAKSWRLLNAILRVFGPHLVPNRSRVIHQDFRHPHTYWLPLVFDSEPSTWREVEAVRQGDTVTFQPLAPVGGPAHTDYSDATFTSEQAEAVLRRRIRGSARSHAQPYRLALLRRKTVERDGAGVARLAAEITAAARPTDPILEQLAQVRRTYADESLAAAAAALGRGAPGDAAACAEWLGSEPEAALLRGLLHEHRGEAAQAAACYASAGDVVETLRARSLRAQVLLLAGRPQAACEHLERALLLRGGGGEGPVHRAFQLLLTALERRGDVAAAVASLDRLAPVWRGDARYEILRATVLYHAGRREEGRERLLGVLRRDPHAARAKQLLEEWFP